MGVLRIVVVLPALFTRKEVQLGSGTIHESHTRGRAAYVCVRVCQNLHKDYLMCKCTFHRWGAVYLMQHVYVCVYVWRKNVIQGAGCASVTWNSVHGSVSTDLQQRFSIFSTSYELLKLKNYLFFFNEILEISYLINKNHITSLE